MSDTDAQFEAMMEQARKTLGLTTWRERGSDSLDFYDLHVGTLAAAIVDAYKAGYTEAMGRAMRIVESSLGGHAHATPL